MFALEKTTSYQVPTRFRWDSFPPLTRTRFSREWWRHSFSRDWWRHSSGQPCWSSDLSPFGLPLHHLDDWPFRWAPARPFPRPIRQSEPDKQWQRLQWQLVRSALSETITINNTIKNKMNSLLYKVILITFTMKWKVSFIKLTKIDFHCLQLLFNQLFANLCNWICHALNHLNWFSVILDLTFANSSQTLTSTLSIFFLSKDCNFRFTQTQRKWHCRVNRISWKLSNPKIDLNNLQNKQDVNTRGGQNVKWHFVENAI